MRYRKKKCTICGAEKRLESFNKDGFDSQGQQRIRSRCKACDNAERKAGRVPKKLANGTYLRPLDHEFKEARLGKFNELMRSM